MSPAVMLPTYNEAGNLRAIVQAILRAGPNIAVVIVDDDSPDGTGRIADELAQKEERVRVIHRMERRGRGYAGAEGFRYCVAQGFDPIFEMDADFSHDPHELPNLVAAAAAADLVLGSRYVDGIRITNWPLRRLMLSKGAAMYVRLITGMPVTDPTGGFKCYRRRVLAAIDLDAIMSNGYAFQVEMTHSAWMRGFKIVEIPITFEDRRAGYSKMDSTIFQEALGLVWKLAVRHGFRRRPLGDPGPVTPPPGEQR